MDTTNLALPAAEVEARSFITRVYGWMCAGLALTGWIAWFVGGNPALVGFLVSNRILFYGLMIGELALVIGLVGWVKNMTAAAATLAFLIYAAFNGLTLSVIFLVYTAASITSAFFITSGTFGIMSFYGYTTKKDLTSVGNICFMALLGLILASVVNLFMHNSTLMWITTYAGILIFVGLTAYDTQKIKNMNVIGNNGSDEDKKEAIMGALTLYLDFINLFLMILRATGKRR
jgi:hypothetical protein